MFVVCLTRLKTRKREYDGRRFGILLYALVTSPDSCVQQLETEGKRLLSGKERMNRWLLNCSQFAGSLLKVSVGVYICICLYSFLLLTYGPVERFKMF